MSNRKTMSARINCSIVFEVEPGRDGAEVARIVDVRPVDLSVCSIFEELDHDGLDELYAALDEFDEEHADE